MSNRRRNWRPKRIFSRYVALPLTYFLLWFFLSSFILIQTLWLQPTDLQVVFDRMMQAPMLLLLNFLPIALLTLAFSALFNNIFYGAAFAGGLSMLLSVINRVKIQIREDPFSPQDFSLFREGAHAMQEYDITWPTAMLLMVAFFVLLCLFLGRISRFPKTRSIPRLLLRLGLGAAPMLLLFWLVSGVYADAERYNSYEVSNVYNLPTVYCERGYLYSFCNNITAYRVTKPEGYDPKKAADWNNSVVNVSEDKTRAVNVIVIQNEAFSDITDWDGFNYTKKTDPLSNFHALQKEDHALSGHIVVPQFAGGTANTEFDVFTGVQTINTSASAFRSVNRNMGSLYRVFDTDDYDTSFIHPGKRWFYNRENVYRYLGCEDILFKPDLGKIGQKEGWVGDEELGDFIIDSFENTVAEGQYLFNQTVTIQNHMAYTETKYGGYEVSDAPLTVKMSHSDMRMLSIYVQGIRGADIMLSNLTRYFKKSNEPVVLVFYGDHLPYLGDNQRIYEELGKDFTPEETLTPEALEAYETPYIIWANDAGAKAIDWENTVATMAMPADGTISACYMGATILELTGRADHDPWFRYLAAMRKKLPVVTGEGVVNADGEFLAISDLPKSERALIDKMKQWGYYRLRDDNVEASK